MWYKDGIQFECQGSGKCCSSRGEYGYVYMTKEDRQNMAKALDMPTRDFTLKYCRKEEGLYILKENPDSPDCIFLEKNKCKVYLGRPMQCRTWPFWPENMNAKRWKKDIVEFCPGINKGKLYSAEEIKTTLAKQELSEAQLID